MEAERLATAEEAATLATAKDELFALSNKAQLGFQRAAHHDAEAVDLASRADTGTAEAAALRAKAAAQAASIDEIAGRLGQLDEEAADTEQGYEAEAAAQEQRRAALTSARAAPVKLQRPAIRSVRSSTSSAPPRRCCSPSGPE